MVFFGGVVALSAVLAGCVDGGEPDYCANAGLEVPSLELGTSHVEHPDGTFVENTYTGGFAFERLSPGSPLYFYLGVQGGNLVFASVKTKGLFPGTEAEIRRHIDDSSFPTQQEDKNPTLRYELVDEDGMLVAAQIADEPLLPDGTQAVRDADRVIVVPGLRPSDIEGRTVTLRVTAEDYCGMTASDEMPGLVLEYIPPPNEQQE